MATKMMKCPVCNDMYVSWREKDNEEWSIHLRCRPTHKTTVSLGGTSSVDPKFSMDAMGSVDFVPPKSATVSTFTPRTSASRPEHKRGESMPFIASTELNESVVITPKWGAGGPPRRPFLVSTPSLSSVLAPRMSTKQTPHRVGPSNQEMVGSLPAKFSLMTSDFSAVFAQASIGVRQISAFKDFCARMSRHEAKNAKKLDLIITEESAKIAKATEGDRVVAFTEMWERVVLSMREAVSDGLKASELIDREVILPLDLLEQKVAKSLKNIHTQASKHETEMKKSLAALAKSQEECSKVFSLISVPKETKESVAKTPQYQTKWQALKQQVKEHAVKAQEASNIVDTHNANVGECLDELQELELLRLQFLTIHLERLIVIRRDLRGLEALDKALESVRSVNARTCLHMFVADWFSDFGPPVKQPLPHALPLSPEQMEKAEFSIDDFRQFVT